MPQFMTGWPTMLAAAHWVAGWPGIFMLPAVVGGCAILALAGLAGRLVGQRWAPLAALWVALAWPVLRVSPKPPTRNHWPASFSPAVSACCWTRSRLDVASSSTPLAGDRRRVLGAGFASVP